MNYHKAIPKNLFISLSLCFGILVGCASTPGGIKVNEGTLKRDTVEESDREGAKRFDVAEDENEPPLDPIAPDDDITGGAEHADQPPLLDETLIAVPPTPDQIRAGTWNVRLLGATKANKDNPISLLQRGDGKVWEAVIQLMAAASIHALAVQEVYLSTFAQFDEQTNVASVFAEEKKDDHPLLNPPPLPDDDSTGPSGNDAGGSWGFYRGINGDPVFEYSFSWTAGQPNQRKRLERTEYCPVIYDTRKLVCEEKENKPIGGRPGGKERNVHFVACSTHDERFEFEFGCAHFAADPRITDRNIARTGTLMEGKKIIGGDFNSYRFGAKQGKWKDASDQGRKISMDPNTQVTGGGGFTKIHKKKSTGEIGFREEVIWRILDDLIWTVAVQPFYIPDSKRVLDFGKDIDDEQPFYQDYHRKVSDHMPVISDFIGMLEGGN